MACKATAPCGIVAFPSSDPLKTLTASAGQDISVYLERPPVLEDILTFCSSSRRCASIHAYISAMSGGNPDRSASNNCEHSHNPDIRALSIALHGGHADSHPEKSAVYCGKADVMLTGSAAAGWREKQATSASCSTPSISRCVHHIDRDRHQAHRHICQLPLYHAFMAVSH
eukprot:1820235-Rhodomonas_salina.2